MRKRNAKYSRMNDNNKIRQNKTIDIERIPFLIRLRCSSKGLHFGSIWCVAGAFDRLNGIR